MSGDPQGSPFFLLESHWSPLHQAACRLGKSHMPPDSMEIRRRPARSRASRRPSCRCSRGCRRGARCRTRGTTPCAGRRSQFDPTCRRCWFPRARNRPLRRRGRHSPTAARAAPRDPLLLRTAAGQRCSRRACPRERAPRIPRASPARARRRYAGSASSPSRRSRRRNRG